MSASAQANFNGNIVSILQAGCLCVDLHLQSCIGEPNGSLALDRCYRIYLRSLRPQEASHHFWIDIPRWEHHTDHFWNWKQSGSGTTSPLLQSFPGRFRFRHVHRSDSFVPVRVHAKGDSWPLYRFDPGFKQYRHNA